MSVFNAETIIIGLFSGFIGIVLAVILQFPLNAILYSYTGISSLVVLSPVHAILLVAVSVVVTLLSGMIPSFMASKKDPVKALRSE
jgi:putative ABC transport system permease protein